jgi:hypothetical protein
MTNPSDCSPTPLDAELMRLWQDTTAGTPDPERVAREIMAHVWRFDRVIVRRNFREYAAGLVLVVFFTFQMLVDRPQDRIGGALGLVSVGFVMGYIFWKHRGLAPLDPAADAAVYRRALLARIDRQIRLIQSVPYWYLLPLFLPGLWTARKVWDRSPVAAVLGLAIMLIVFAGIGWLNVRLVVKYLHAERDRVDRLFTAPREDE